MDPYFTQPYPPGSITPALLQQANRGQTNAFASSSSSAGPSQYLGGLGSNIPPNGTTQSMANNSFSNWQQSPQQFTPPIGHFPPPQHSQIQYQTQQQQQNTYTSGPPSGVASTSHSRPNTSNTTSTSNPSPNLSVHSNSASNSNGNAPSSSSTTTSPASRNSPTNHSHQHSNKIPPTTTTQKQQRMMQSQRTAHLNGKLPAPLVEPHQDLQSFLEMFWTRQIRETEDREEEFKGFGLPLARIKKVMKSDEEVKMISAEAPILFSKACEIFIAELTCRAWLIAESHKRRTLQKSDVAAAIACSDMFDFLIDIVPRDEGEEGTATAADGVAAEGGFGEEDGGEGNDIEEGDEPGDEDEIGEGEAGGEDVGGNRNGG